MVQLAYRKHKLDSEVNCDDPMSLMLFHYVTHRNADERVLEA